MVKNVKTNIRPLSPALQAKAISELNEVPERIPEDLQHVKDWLKQQPHINARLDDQWLMAFLRGCKFNLETVKEKLDAYYMSKTLIPEFFANVDPFAPKLQRLLKLGLFLPLPSLVPNGPVILLVRNKVYDTMIDSFDDIHMLWMMIMNILMMENDNFVVAGHCFLIDAEDVTVAHYAIPAGNVEKMLTLFQKTLPIRIKSFYCINTTPIYEICFNIIKSFIGDKLRKKTKKFSKGHMESFYEEYPRKLLPKEYGGEVVSVQELTDIWKKKVESYAQWFKEDGKYCTNEHLRPDGDPKSVFDVFGVEGTFKKLSID